MCNFQSRNYLKRTLETKNILIKQSLFISILFCLTKEKEKKKLNRDKKGFRHRRLPHRRWYLFNYIKVNDL